jgi:thioredoxin reductase
MSAPDRPSPVGLTDTPADRPPGETVRTDVAIVGAGPAGLSAALAAAGAGAGVVLIDAYRRPGGQFYRQPAAEFRAAGPAGHQREGAALREAAAAAGVEMWSETAVWGAFDGPRLGLDGPGAPAFLEARAVVVAAGAYERAAAFPGWTLPGVMTAGAAQTLLKEQRILPGRRAVLAGTGPLQLVVAAALVEAGAEVVAVLEGSPAIRRSLRRPFANAAALWGQWDRLAEGLSAWWTLRRAGVPYSPGWGVTAAEGGGQVEAVTVARLDEAWRPVPGTQRRLACDTLCCGYGFVPATELARLLGVRHAWRPDQGGWAPARDEHMETDVPGVFVAGDGAGIGGAGLALVEGRIAGLAAAARVSGRSQEAAIARLAPALRRERRFQRLYTELFTPGPGLDELAGPETVICRCEEVTRAEVAEAVARGADVLDAVKVLTRCGMGDCQGRVCGPLVAAVVAGETGRSPAELGAFRPRPPIFPVPITTLAGGDGTD